MGDAVRDSWNCDTELSAGEGMMPGLLRSVLAADSVALRHDCGLRHSGQLLGDNRFGRADMAQGVEEGSSLGAQREG
eukprot:6787019-Prymnesium_polylepis.1